MNSARWRPLTEGAPIILPLAAAGIAAVRLFPPAAPVAFLAASGVAFAFRDPERDIRPRPDVALAPADGRVIRVEPVFDEYWKTALIEVAIFLALWDVHVQRIPLDGQIEAQRRRSGGYWPAMTHKAAHRNNQLATHIGTAGGPCTVTQISGLVARRIVSWAKTGERVMQGERLGMIKFGSQVTLRLPLASTILVREGEHVLAGITPIAKVTPVGPLMA